jgi:CheY-like chemotaxis protein
MFGVERAARLTRQLLAFARRQPLEPRSIDLSTAIRNMAEILQRALGERIEVETVVGGGLWNVLIDPVQFENTVLNLAINARDAMLEGGRLTIELANAYLDERYARENVDVTPGQYVMLGVTDTGHGMTPDVMARVFEPFFSTKKEGEGTGLGLSQVYGFVKQSGGHVKFYSEVGHGTTVKLYLPRTRKPQDVYSPLEMQPIEGGSETVLVVEDDDGVRASVVDMLTGLGYTVLRAANAGEALAILGTEAKVDLLFTDVVMPGPIPTPELARRARQMHTGIKVLFTSGYTHNAIVHNGRLDEGVALISKPYRKEELARKLRTVIEGIEDVPAALEAGPDGPTVKPKVLVVEDDAMIRIGIADMATELGYPVVEAACASEALNLLRVDETIGILLTDVGLPDQQGDELACEAKRLRPGLKTILCSGYSSHSAPPGADLTERVLLPKPFDIRQLEAAFEGRTLPRAGGR